MFDLACRSPFERLVLLERLCLQHASGLPQQKKHDEDWRGIGFRLGGLQLAAPLEEVSEILTPPLLSHVPRTKAWVCGIANVRGNLMPIMDLQSFLHDKPAMLNRRSRILVINHQGIYSGLVVDAILGLRHFREEWRCDELPGDDARIHQYMTHGYRTDTGHWGVFSTHKLAEAPQFLKAAV
jgi:twitching motility protein PilI